MKAREYLRRAPHLGISDRQGLDLGARIVFLLWRGVFGGAERHTLELCRALQGEGRVTPEIWFLADGGQLADHAREAGIGTRALGWRRGAAGMTSRLGAPEGAGSWVVVVNGYGPAVFAALRSRPCGVIVVEHGGALSNPGLSSARARLVERTTRRLAHGWVDAEVWVSRFMQDVQSAAPHAENLVRIPNGVNTREYVSRDWTDADLARIATGKIRIRAAGRIVPEKGFGLLIDAVHDLRSSGIRPLLEVAGDGPAASDLRARVETEGLADIVSFVGRVSDMRSFWGAADVVAVPSFPVVESFGMTAIEASACGIPVCAADAGGLTETVVHGKTGWLVEPGSAHAIADGVRAYVADPRLLVEHGQAARHRCERHYDLLETAREYSALAEAIAQR